MFNVPWQALTTSGRKIRKVLQLPIEKNNNSFLIFFSPFLINIIFVLLFKNPVLFTTLVRNRYIDMLKKRFCNWFFEINYPKQCTNSVKTINGHQVTFEVMFETGLRPVRLSNSPRNFRSELAYFLLVIQVFFKKCHRSNILETFFFTRVIERDAPCILHENTVSISTSAPQSKICRRLTIDR